MEVEHGLPAFPVAVEDEPEAAVGIGNLSDGQVDHFVDAGDEGLAMAERIDRRVDRLPGLGGLHLVRDAVSRRFVDRRPSV